MSLNSIILGVDFDGTLVDHKFPDIGFEVPYAFDVLRRLQFNNTHVVLFTCRSGLFLDHAVKYCKERGIEFWGVNENPLQKAWSTSPKAYCNFYVDDSNLGCPLVIPAHGRPYVDWIKVGHDLYRAVGLDIDGELPRTYGPPTFLPGIDNVHEELSFGNIIAIGTPYKAMEELSNGQASGPSS